MHPQIVSPSRQRFNELVQRVDLIDAICEHVASGGNLVELCEKSFKVPFGYISNWIRSSQERDSRYKAALYDRKEFDHERVLKELRHIGISDIRQLFNSDNSLKPVPDWPEHVARAVSSVETEELYEGSGRDRKFIGYTKRVKFWDKTRSLELIGKTLGLFTDKTEHTVTLTLADLVRGSFAPSSRDAGAIRASEKDLVQSISSQTEGGTPGLQTEIQETPPLLSTQKIDEASELTHSVAGVSGRVAKNETVDNSSEVASEKK